MVYHREASKASKRAVTKRDKKQLIKKCILLVCSTTKRLCTPWVYFENTITLHYIGEVVSRDRESMLTEGYSKYGSSISQREGGRRFSSLIV